MDDPSNAIGFSLDTAVDWLSNEVQKRPQSFFGYVYLFPPHAPYNSKQDFIGRFSGKPFDSRKPKHHFSEGKNQKNLDRKRTSYAKAIAYVDAVFGRLRDALKSTDSLNNTCLFVTSDHGEIFERGISGHISPVLYEPLLDIPLIISYPGQDHCQEIHVPTHAVDILPTLLGISGAGIPTHLQSLIPPNTSQGTQAFRDLLFCDAKSNPKSAALQKASIALLRDPFKLIYYRVYKGFDEILSFMITPPIPMR